jgi:hypothetical protein
LLAFSLGVDHALGIGRTDHLAGLFVQQDAQRSAISQAESAEVHIFCDQGIDKMFAARAVNDSNQRSPATAAVLFLIFIARLKLQSSPGPLFRLDPFRQGAAQCHSRRRWIGQVLLEARQLQRLLQVGMADANPLQSP